MSRRPTVAQVSEAKRAAADAEQAADDAVKGLKLTKKFADEAARDRQRVEELTPDPYRDAVAALANQEQSALLRIGPKRNRWRDWQRFEERLVEIELRRQELLDEIGAARGELAAEPARHTTALSDWLAAESKGERPASRVPELEHRIADLQAEHDALGIHYDKALRDRLEHVERNRKQMGRDVRKAIERAAEQYRHHIDGAEAARREVRDLRQTQVWAAIFPHPSLANEPNTQALVGAKKRIQGPLVPNVETGLIAESIFNLLRADVSFCATVATVDQAAAEQGVTPNQLTGRESSWQNGQVDYVGIPLDAVWDKSPEQAEQARRVQAYTEAQRRRLWGDQVWGDQ